MQNVVLLVDDADDFRNLVAEILGDHDLIVFQSASAMDALLQLKSGIRPGLIVTDIQMPDLSGIEMVLCIREEPAYNEIPIVICSMDNRADMLSVDFCNVRVVLKEIPQVVDVVCSFFGIRSRSWRLGNRDG